MGIAMDLYIAFGKMTILTILVLLIYEHGRFLHFMKSSSISFFSDLKVLSFRSFTCLVRITTGYFILFVAIVKGIIYLISFSACLYFEYMKATDLLELILFLGTLLKLYEFSCGILGGLSILSYHLQIVII